MLTPNQNHWIWVVLPVLPVLIGFWLLNVISDGSTTLLSDAIAADAFRATARHTYFFNALIIFAAVGLFQVIGCFAVAVFAGLSVQRMPLALRRDAWLVFAVSVMLVVVVSIVARQDGFSGALNIAYRTTCAALVSAQVAPHIMPVSCTAPGISSFAWLGLLPYMAGILAAAAASAAVSVAPRLDDLGRWADLLEQAFRATAFVLVASTIAMMLFYYLPQAVVDDKDTRDLLAGFAQGMTLFWGIVFSLTLLAVFGPAYLLLGRAMAEAEVTDAELKERMAERSLPKQAARVLTTLAPLLVGSSASVIDMLSGALGG